MEGFISVDGQWVKPREKDLTDAMREFARRNQTDLILRKRTEREYRLLAEKGVVEEGMKPEEVYLALGFPDRVERRLYEQREFDQWIYGRTTTTSSAGSSSKLPRAAEVVRSKPRRDQWSSSGLSGLSRSFGPVGCAPLPSLDVAALVDRAACALLAVLAAIRRQAVLGLVQARGRALQGSTGVTGGLAGSAAWAGVWPAIGAPAPAAPAGGDAACDVACPAAERRRPPAHAARDRHPPEGRTHPRQKARLAGPLVHDPDPLVLGVTWTLFPETDSRSTRPSVTDRRMVCFSVTSSWNSVPRTLTRACGSQGKALLRPQLGHLGMEGPAMNEQPHPLSRASSSNRTVPGPSSASSVSRPLQGTRAKRKPWSTGDLKAVPA